MARPNWWLGYAVQWRDMRGQWGHSPIMSESDAETRYAEEVKDDSGQHEVYLLEYVEHSPYPLKRKTWKRNAEQQGS